ncbi:hypothetical protein, partial [Rhizobium sp. Root708]|uniref:hypothetical protein n=1 Tax=Rhizobium sp. Root708 TaxID=1736592 RepID=UPI001AECB7CD
EPISITANLKKSQSESLRRQQRRRPRSVIRLIDPSPFLSQQAFFDIFNFFADNHFPPAIGRQLHRITHTWRSLCPA